MKVLLVHEFYRSSSPSGEDRVFNQERKLLEQNGIDVPVVTFHNDDIGSADGPSYPEVALGTVWSSRGYRMIREAINQHRPDVVHFHNTFPVISPAGLYAAKKGGAATVQTFHNFRSVCAQALLMGEKKPCELCLGRYPWPALLKKCYRGSFLATLPLVASIAAHRLLRTWHEKVDLFIVLSEFNKAKFIEAGLPSQKIRVKPNFVFADQLEPGDHERGRWLYIGRLQEEKGAQYLIPAWERFGEEAPVLDIVGDGPLKTVMDDDIDRLGLAIKVRMHGLCSPGQVRHFLGEASLLILPSTCYEGFPMVIAEAFAAGVAVACAKLGSPEFIVQQGRTGVHFEPGDVDDMVAKLRPLAADSSTLRRFGENARREYEEKYTPEKNVEMLLNIYQEAVALQPSNGQV